MIVRGARWAAVLLGALALAQTAGAQTAVQGQAVQAQARQGAGQPTTYLPNRFAGSAGRFYKAFWGVDSLKVRAAESGELIRFSWRVVDASKAGILNDKRLAPSLEDPQAGVSLVIPSMENIGLLRQTSAAETGKTYWMAFSNKGRRVKPGDRVNVVIGQFRADGLMVD
jgi:hypothetical protein